MGIKIKLTRDSVCAADDYNAPNEKSFEIFRGWTIIKILNEILKANYLPNIKGGKATWSVAIKEPVAVIAQQWSEPKIICLEEFPFWDTRGFVEFDKVHFNYHAQYNPQVVFDVLKRYRNGYE